MRQLTPQLKNATCAVRADAARCITLTFYLLHGLHAVYFIELNWNSLPARRLQYTGPSTNLGSG